MPPIQQTITDYVRAQPEGTLLTTRQLESDCGVQRDQIRRGLNRLANKGLILRLGRGLWQRPKQTRFGPVLASAEQVVEVIANERGAFFIPSGAKVLNELGASSQLPLQSVFVTNRRIRPIRVGRALIQFQYSRAFASAIDKLQSLPKADRRRAAKLWVAMDYVGERDATRYRTALRQAYAELSENGQSHLLHALNGKLRWAIPFFESDDAQPT